MGAFANIVCKTVGIGGMSLAVYDAYKCGAAVSRHTAQMDQADHFQRVHDASRTLDTMSHTNSAIQNKTAELRQNNPMVGIFGNIRGFIKGSLNSLGHNLFPVALSSLALLTKGIPSKIGAWGLAGYGVFRVARDGFGLGKTTPMS